MSDTAAWPDPSRPGVPLNPERDGWHFLIDPFGDLFVREWSAGAECWYEDYSPNKRPTKWRYLGPALARAEVAAAVAAAFDDGARAMREAAARDVGCGCDNRDAVVSARSNAERSRLCGRAPCAALTAMDIRMLPLPAMEKEPSVERTGMAVVGPDERRAMDDALRRSVTITDDCAAAIAEARRAALEEAAWVVDVAQKTATARRMNAAERHDWGEHYRASIRQDTYEDVAAAIRALAGEPSNGKA